MHKPKKTNTSIWSYHYALKEQMWPVSRAQIDIVVFVLEKPTRYLHRHLSVKSTYLNCCLTQAVTLPLAIPPPPPPAQIHQRMIPLGGRRYSMCQKGPLEPNRKPVIHKSEGSLRGCLLICEKQSDLESLYGRPFDRALLLCQCSTCSRHWHPLLPSRSLGNHRGGSAPSPMTSLWFGSWIRNKVS